MFIFNTIYQTHEELKKFRKENKTIGFVPTMGALHEGHLSLLKKARVENDIVVLSIFVNPIQFAPNEDFEKYPRTFEQDCNLAKEIGVDILFAPNIDEMYPSTIQTYINVTHKTEKLCGEKRPGHFQGVLTVVNKLLNIINCNKIYLGQKDYQQFLVIKQMIIDLNIDTEAILCPIIRDENGLALSSRNQYLNNEEKKEALCLYEALDAAKALICEQNLLDSQEIKEILKDIIEKRNLTKIDYIFIGDARTLEPIDKISDKSNILVALAVYIGKTRLIDNILVNC